MDIVIVEDDRDLVDLLNFALRRAGFGVQMAHDVPTASRLLELYVEKSFSHRELIARIRAQI
jgi:DNA-binding response OmpR family regulator